MVAAGLAASCAPTQIQTARSTPRDGQCCFDVGQVTGYDSIDDNGIMVWAGVDACYQIDLQGGQCNSVDWTQKLAIESTPSSWICTAAIPRKITSILGNQRPTVGCNATSRRFGGCQPKMARLRNSAVGRLVQEAFRRLTDLPVGCLEAALGFAPLGRPRPLLPNPIFLASSRRFSA